METQTALTTYRRIDPVAIITKAEHLAATAQQSGTRYQPDHVLMIGDAPGDLAAAQSIGALFYPVLPGSEEASWHRFENESLDRFLAGTYAGEYETELVGSFMKALPEHPRWDSVAEGSVAEGSGAGGSFSEGPVSGDSEDSEAGSGDVSEEASGGAASEGASSGFSPSPNFFAVTRCAGSTSCPETPRSPSLGPTRCV